MKDETPGIFDPSPLHPFIPVDGSYGEGGGQIVRTSVSLAAITGRPVRIENIRAGRSRPGLQAQHLTAVQAMARICGGRLTGAMIGSTLLEFVPGTAEAERRLRIDVGEARIGGSAGSASLIAQTILVPMSLLGAARTVSITGGTHVPMSPPADYLEAVYMPALARVGVRADITCSRAGFYPKGGGEISIDLEAGGPGLPIDLEERGRLKSLTVFVVTSLLPEHVAERGEAAALRGLTGFGVSIEVTRRDLPGIGPGAAVLIVAKCENGIGGFSSLGERGKPMERVVEEAVSAFKRWYAGGAAVDERLADQLVLPCCLAGGESRWTTPRVTEHLRTVLHVAGQFLPIAYEIEEREADGACVRLRGATAGSAGD
jgi:RNA 3'-terminal phosphate cyclase (ATP)